MSKIAMRDFVSMLSQDDMHTGSNIIMLIGPPGSGKSTFTKDFLLHWTDEWILISPDLIRKELTDDESDQSRNTEVFAIVYKRLEEALKAGKNVIYDATNCRNVYRFKILNSAKPFANKIIGVVISTPISECIARNHARDRHVPDDVVERMYFTLKKHPPTLNEGYDILIKI